MKSIPKSNTPAHQIDRVLVLSTGHVSRWVARELDVAVRVSIDTPQDSDALPMLAPWSIYGWIVYAEDPDVATYPSLRLCMDYAVRHGCSYLRFDCDGPVIPDLPTYDS